MTVENARIKSPNFQIKEQTCNKATLQQLCIKKAQQKKPLTTISEELSKLYGFSGKQLERVTKSIIQSVKTEYVGPNFHSFNDLMKLPITQPFGSNLNLDPFYSYIFSQIILHYFQGQNKILPIVKFCMFFQFNVRQNKSPVLITHVSFGYIGGQFCSHVNDKLFNEFSLNTYFSILLPSNCIFSPEQIKILAKENKKIRELSKFFQLCRKFPKNWRRKFKLTI